MFTSRAEYRTLLRQDNADERLTPKSFSLGLASEERIRNVEEKVSKREKLLGYLRTESYTLEAANAILDKKEEPLVKQSDKYAKLLSRPNLTRKDFINFNPLQDYLEANQMNDTIFEQAEIEIKYSGYIEKEKRNADKLKRLENIVIPSKFNYDELASLSHEAKEKLNKLRPNTLAQASRISGIKPSDISVLLVSMGR
jgi:tRNA uridine 5-carboxymethylaminomethyl modification enzyme